MVSAEGVKDFLRRCPAPSSSNSPKPDTPPPGTTTTPSPKSWCSSSASDRNADRRFQFPRGAGVAGATGERGAGRADPGRALRIAASAKSLGSQQDRNFTVISSTALRGGAEDREPGFQRDRTPGSGPGGGPDRRGRTRLAGRVPRPNIAGEKCTTITGLVDGTAYVRLLQYLPGGRCWRPAICRPPRRPVSARWPAG